LATKVTKLRKSVPPPRTTTQTYAQTKLYTQARFSSYPIPADPSSMGMEVVHGPSPSPSNRHLLHTEQHAEHPDEPDKYVVYHKDVIAEHMKQKFHSTRSSGKLHNDQKIEKLVRASFSWTPSLPPPPRPILSDAPRTLLFACPTRQFRRNLWVL
jgi:hypothetical protein